MDHITIEDITELDCYDYILLDLNKLEEKTYDTSQEANGCFICGTYELNDICDKCEKEFPIV